MAPYGGVNLSTLSTQVSIFAAGEISGRACAVGGRGRGRTRRLIGALRLPFRDPFAEVGHTPGWKATTGADVMALDQAMCE